MECEVVIIGLGPVGAVAANLLGQYGISTRVVERNADVYSAPRAIAIDAEASRVFCMIDLGDWLDGHIRKVGAELRTQSPPCGTVLVDASAMAKRRKYGCQQLASIHQPTIEEKLRERLKFFPNVQVYLEHEVTDILEENGRVNVTVRRVAGTRQETFSCKYVLACDGGRSFARRKLGLRYKGDQIREQWLVMDVVSNDQDMEERWPNATVVGSPTRTFLTVALPQNLRRFEMLLQDEEDAARSVRESEAARLLSDVGVDVHKLIFKRRMVYKFHARQVEHWRKGRVLLVGDAAHCMPPIKGQGMCCGVEDAANVCWKVTMVLRGNMKCSLPSPSSEGLVSEQILDSYQMERSPWVSRMTRQNLVIRKLASLRNPLLRFVRDAVLFSGDRIPGVREWLRFEKYKGPPDLQEGFIDQNSAGSGVLFPQPKVQVLVSGTVTSMLLDKVLGYGWCFLVFRRTAGDVLSVSSLQEFENAGCQTVHILARGSDLTTAPQGSREVVIVDVEDELKGWFRQHLVDAALLRPDRFVFGTVQAGCSGDHLVESLHAMLSGVRPLAPPQPTWHRNWPLLLVLALLALFLFFCVLK